MALELTRDQAAIYLGDLLEVLTRYSHMLAAAAVLGENTPGGGVPEGMLRSLLEGWEILDSRFNDMYHAIYGSHPKDFDQASGSGAEASVGPPAVQ